MMSFFYFGKDSIEDLLAMIFRLCLSNISTVFSNVHIVSDNAEQLIDFLFSRFLIYFQTISFLFRYWTLFIYSVILSNDKLGIFNTFYRKIFLLINTNENQLELVVEPI